ncbi:hypothetical protein XANCAGTX0491_006799 [Xanthoria calcicola]
MKLFIAISTFALQATAALLPVRNSDLEPLATTPATPACTADSDVVVNGGFYGYPNPDTYAPFMLGHKVGSPGCKYVHGYTPCLGALGFGASDPDCFLCEYGNAGGSDTISQDITFAPGCQYIVEATVACWGHSGTDYGSPHVFFRVTLDHTIVIPQQLSCPNCTSSSQAGCAAFPEPTYKIVSGNVVGPASGKGTLKLLISQAPQKGSVQPLMVTALRMITPGTGPFT